MSFVNVALRGLFDVILLPARVVPAFVSLAVISLLVGMAAQQLFLCQHHAQRQHLGFSQNRIKGGQLGFVLGSNLQCGNQRLEV